jgi:hypothetical protein
MQGVVDGRELIVTYETQKHFEGPNITRAKHKYLPMLMVIRNFSSSSWRSKLVWLRSIVSSSENYSYERKNPVQPEELSWQLNSGGKDFKPGSSL